MRGKIKEKGEHLGVVVGEVVAEGVHGAAPLVHVQGAAPVNIELTFIQKQIINTKILKEKREKKGKRRENEERKGIGEEGGYGRSERPGRRARPSEGRHRREPI